jgi:hypothetical protein
VLDIGRLTAVGTEVTLPGTARSLDLLAELSDGRRVAIENQFGQADHDHLTRGFAYAVGLAGLPEGVAALVVIAEDHGAEFVAIADYFNRAAEALGDEGIAVFLVRLLVEQVGEFLLPRFEVLSRPNTWRTEIAESRLLGSVEEFMDRLDEPLRSTVSGIVAAWQARPGTSIGHKARDAIGLYLSNPAARSGRTALFVVWGDGSLVVNVGYIRDSGLLDDEGVAQLEELVDRLFPSHTTGEKRYFFNGRITGSEPIEALADWIAARAEEYSTSSGT